ncbi:MAG: type II secretion system F family protein [Alphaproteobacteria bacterium]|nr:type II secretion system F family protein [Alphaproteobacteria bacterium]
MDLEQIILFLSFAGAFLSIVAIGLPLVPRDTFSSRLKAVAKRREELQAQQRAKLTERKGPRRQEPRHNYMKLVVDRLNLQKAVDAPNLRNRLSQAGWRGRRPAYTFVFLRVALPLLFGAIAAVVTFGSANLDSPVALKLLMCGGAAFVGYLIPGILLTNTVKKRQSELLKGFPDSLDLITICVEAGLSMEGAFSRVTEEIAESSPILAEEFGLTTAELAFLGDRRQALENFSFRTGQESIKALVTSLIQSEKYGTPLGVALRVLSKENREARMSRAEKKAGGLPAALTVPMILFFLPVLFLVLVGPAAIQVANTFQ